MGTNSNTNPELQKLILENSNNLHLEVVKLLRAKGWKISVSPYYIDELSSKPREIDIIATKREQVTDITLGQERKSSFSVTLCIECKYLKKDAVFWMDDDIKIDVEEIIKSGLEKITDPRETNPHWGAYLFDHHYSKLTREKGIAILYASPESDSNGNKIFDSFTQAIKSLIFFRNRYSSKPSVYYPVVIYKPEKIHLFDVNTTKIKQQGDSGLFINYTYGSKETAGNILNEKFIIDYVHLGDIDIFLESLEKEIEAIKNMMKYEISQNTILGYGETDDSDEDKYNLDPYE